MFKDIAGLGICLSFIRIINVSNKHRNHYIYEKELKLTLLQCSQYVQRFIRLQYCRRMNIKQMPCHMYLGIASLQPTVLCISCCHIPSHSSRAAIIPYNFLKSSYLHLDCWFSRLHFRHQTHFRSLISFTYRWKIYSLFSLHCSIFPQFRLFILSRILYKARFAQHFQGKQNFIKRIRNYMNHELKIHFFYPFCCRIVWN